MKVGLIRCAQTEEMCPATTCLEFIRDQKGSFAEIDQGTVCVGVSTCGGCPGKKAGLRAANMVKRGAEAIAMASCISLGTPINFSCPFAKKMRDTIQGAVGENIPIIGYTHEPGKKLDKLTDTHSIRTGNTENGCM